VLGQHPETDTEVRLRKGRYGYYLEMDLADGNMKKTAVPKKLCEAGDFDMTQAVEALQFPMVPPPPPPFELLPQFNTHL